MKIYLLCIVFLMISCSDKSVRTSYSVDGQIKSVCEYSLDKRNGKEIQYCKDGKIYQTFNYVNDTLNGLATRYYSNGNVRNVGFYFNGKMVGPIYYFNKNKKLVSYNERDFENVVIYVKKYDSLGNLLSESGAPFSQYLKIANPRKIIYFIFTEPEGYSNKLNVYINDCPTNVYYNNASKNHVAFIKFPNYLLNSISIKKLTIKSKLFSKAGNLLMENEINYAIKDSLNIISLIVK